MQRRSRIEQWEGREERVLGILPYILLGLCVLATPLIQSPDLHAPVGVVVALSAATAAWMLWWTTLHPAWRERSGLMRAHFVGLVALMAALVVLAPWYGFFTFTGYFFVIWLPDLWKPFAVLAVAAVTGTSQYGGLPDGSAGSIAVYALIIAVNAGVAGTVMFFAHAGALASERRARLVDELTKVNTRLETSLRENAALQDELVARARQDAVTGERQRMAREMHDTLAQGLAGIITQLEAAEQARDTPAWERHLRRARALARDSLADARRSVHAMRPEPLEEARLPEALEGEARRFSELHGVRADVTTTGVARTLRAEIEVTLLRAAQEALANVAKHAAAGRVGLTLSYMDDIVTLDVRDDGTGFTVNGHARGHASEDGGFGLLGMRQRVAGLDGTLQIESEPGAGTALSVSVPALEPA
jgi:signal transduction histidine kinase